MFSQSITMDSIITEPITGQEPWKGEDSPSAALIQFYDAFNHKYSYQPNL